uniref:Uncharacterized protein n=1 Tax=Opuntia streptacantha TaxID=393608 RepID=A0A7C9APH1_OPUST
MLSRAGGQVAAEGKASFPWSSCMLFLLVIIRSYLCSLCSNEPLLLLLLFVVGLQPCPYPCIWYSSSPPISSSSLRTWSPHGFPRLWLSLPVCIIQLKSIMVLYTCQIAMGKYILHRSDMNSFC